MRPLIFLTGGNGLVGSHVLALLVQQGYRIRVLLRDGSDRSTISNYLTHCEVVEGDCTSYLPLAYLEGVHTVIHAAAAVSFDPQDKELLTRTNVEGTKQLLHVSVAAGVSRWIQISSVAALGRSPSRLLMDETATWEESSANSHYAVTKYLADLEVARASAEGLSTATLCPSVVIGAGLKGKSSTQLLEYVAAGKRWVTDGFVNIVGVWDVARAVLLLVDHQRIEGRFILNAHTLTYQELFSKLADAMLKPSPDRLLQPWQMKIALPWLRLWAKITRQKPMLTAETIAASTSHYRYNGNRITEVMPFEYEPLGKTIEQAVRSFVDK